MALVFAPAAIGQVLQGRPTLFENARIITADGPVIEAGSILIRQGRIVAVGTEIAAPENARRVDLSGRTVTPGLIDAAGNLGLTAAGNVGGAMLDVLDAVNPYSYDEFNDALRSGLTTFALPVTGGNGVQGRGTVTRLTRSRAGARLEPVEDSRMLCINLASGDNATGRLMILDGLRNRYRQALEYRETVELYEEEQLPEYLKKIEERAQKKEEGEGGEDEAEQGGEDGDAGETPPARRGPVGRGGRGGRGNFAADADSSDSDQDSSATTMQDPPRPIRGGRGGRGGLRPGGAPQQRGGGNGNDEISKPQKPARNPDAEVLLLTVDRELPVLIAADRSADILNALELADEFGISIAILGGAEAHAVASTLADADVAVILTPDTADEELGGQIHLLEAAGVRWTIGSGDAPARGLLAAAQVATRYADLGTIELLTARAADVLRLGDTAGRIMRGGDADMVVWSGDPGDPASRVETVYVNGRIVYPAPNADEQGGAP